MRQAGGVADKLIPMVKNWVRRELGEINVYKTRHSCFIPYMNTFNISRE